MAFSVIIPAKNEGKHLPELVRRLDKTIPEGSEIIIVNNGSTDGSSEINYVTTKSILWVANFKKGEKTFALKKGIEKSKGDIIAMIDADLQYDPEYVSALLITLKAENVDLVNAWRDFSVYPTKKRTVSKLYNWFYRRMFKVSIHDANSGLKVFKREVAESFIYRKGFHRYFVAMASDAGYKISEVKVPLNKGSKSEFGTSRIFLGLFDMVSVKFSMTILKQPMLFFGGISLLLFVFGGIYLLFDKTWLPLIVLVSGFVSLMFGLIAEMIINLEDEWRLLK